VRTKSQEQADKMLDAATRLFGGQRFHEVRMEDIAAEAGVGKGTIYRYFADKEELFLALLKRASDQFLAQCREAMNGQKATQAKLTAIVGSGLRFFDEQPHLGPLIQRVEVVHGAKSPWQASRDSVVGWVTEILRLANESEEYSIPDPEHAAHMLLGGLRSISFFGRKPRPKGIAAIIVSDFLFGVTRKK
jgi:AcrR family transcriptional regulator